FSQFLASSRASADGVTVARSTTLSSAFDTTFWVTIRTSAGLSSIAWRVRAATITDPRSSPALISGMPSIPVIVTEPAMPSRLLASSARLKLSGLRNVRGLLKTDEPYMSLSLVNAIDVEVECRQMLDQAGMSQRTAFYTPHAFNARGKRKRLLQRPLVVGAD